MALYFDKISLDEIINDIINFKFSHWYLKRLTWGAGVFENLEKMDFNSKFH